MEMGCKSPGNGDDMILILDGYMIDPKSGKEGDFDILIDGDKIVRSQKKSNRRVR